MTRWRTCCGDRRHAVRLWFGSNKKTPEAPRASRRPHRAVLADLLASVVAQEQLELRFTPAALAHILRTVKLARTWLCMCAYVFLSFPIWSSGPVPSSVASYGMQNSRSSPKERGIITLSTVEGQGSVGAR